MKILCLAGILCLSGSTVYGHLTYLPGDTVKAYNQFVSAQKLFSAQKFTGAAEEYLKAAEIYKANKAWKRYVASLVEAGNSYRKAREFDKGIQILDLAEKEIGNNLNAEDELLSLLFYRRGFCYHQKGLTSKAINDYKNAIKYRLQ